MNARGRTDKGLPFVELKREMVANLLVRPETAELIDRFASMVLLKLAKAERKHGYTTEWLNTDWQDDCTASLFEHLKKGDPRDVAAFCAFMWWHGWPTSLPRPPHE